MKIQDQTDVQTIKFSSVFASDGYLNYLHLPNKILKLRGFQHKEKNDYFRPLKTYQELFPLVPDSKI